MGRICLFINIKCIVLQTLPYKVFRQTTASTWNDILVSLLHNKSYPSSLFCQSLADKKKYINIL
jgi:hypothetical protein